MRVVIIGWAVFCAGAAVLFAAGIGTGYRLADRKRRRRPGARLRDLPWTDHHHRRRARRARSSLYAGRHMRDTATTQVLPRIGGGR